MIVRILAIAVVAAFTAAPAVAAPTDSGIHAALNATAHTAVGRVMAPDPSLAARIDRNVPGVGINAKKVAEAGALPAIASAAASSPAVERVLRPAASVVAAR